MISVQEIRKGETFYNGGTVIQSVDFPDGTKLLKYNPNEDAEEFIVNWLYDNDAELFQLIAITKHLKKFGSKKVSLFMPYIPNARMDRVKNNDEVFTLKAFADTINWLGFDQVEVINPHSTVSEALFNNIKVNFDYVKEDVTEIVRGMGLDIDAIFYPDAGAHKKFGDLLSGLNIPSMYGEKIRDWKTGQIKGLSIMNPQNCKGKTCLMVDDIISYGGSMYFSALELQKMGFENIYCYATHVENSILDPDRGKLIKLDCIKKIFTTNSIYRGNHDKIQVISYF